MDGVELLAEFLSIVCVIRPEHIVNLIHRSDYLVIANHEGITHRLGNIQIRNIICRTIQLA